MNALPPLLALFMSGAASLTLETLWFEWLALHWGRTAEASAAVLACFMLGLGLGQWLMAKARRLPINNLRLWAFAEISVGLLAILCNWRFAQTDNLSGNLLGNNAVLWMLLPTLVMGMTLPLAVSVLRQNQLGSRIGLAYAANTLGAALGALLSAWWLVREFGLMDSGHIAVTAQLLVGLVLLAAKPNRNASSNPKCGAPNPKADSVTADYKSTPNYSTTCSPLLAVLSSGLFVLGMEILWFRALLLSHRSTSENFAVMLAAVLWGLALGSSLATAAQRRWALPTHSSIASLLIAQAVVCIISFSLWQPGAGSLLLDSLWLIAPSCICSGALMVVAAQAFHVSDARANSARLVLASTIGSSIGAPLVALVLLPSVGVATSMWVLLSATVLAALFNQPRLTAVAALAIAILAWPLAERWTQKQTRAAQLYMQLDNAEIVTQADGKYQSVQLLESDFLGQPLSHRLMTDSYSMTSTAADSERYMRLFAWLPQAMHSNIQDALLISYGVGTTAEALLQNPSLKSLTVADPSSTILATSRLIPRAPQPLDDPRVDIQTEDGRKVLTQSAERFDLVTGEPPPPRLAGMHALYSEEYFTLMHQALKPAGWASYWLPVDQLSPASSKAIVNAFCSAFADCTLWAGSHYNWILLGSKRGQPNAQALNALFDTTPQLQDSGFEHPAQLASTFIAGPHSLRQWAGNTPTLTDNWPHRIESLWPTEQDIEGYAQLMDAAELHYSHSLYQQLWQLNSEVLEMAWALQPLMNGQFRPTPEQRLNVVKQLLALTPWQTPILWTLGTDHQRLNIANRSSEPSALLHQAVGQLSARDFAGAAKAFQALSTQYPLAADLAAIAGAASKKP